jgi:hypothetical protein
VVSKTSQTYNFSSSVTFLLITDRHLHVLARNASPPGIVAALDPADANDLNDFAPEADGRAVESLFVGVDAGSLPDQVCLVRADEAGALEELPSAESDDGCLARRVRIRTWIGWNDSGLTKDEHGVVDEEVLHVPGPERGVTVEEDDEDHPSLADVSL